jgi:hypothetical protein
VLRDFFVPAVLSYNLGKETFARKLYVVSCLQNVNAIKLLEDAEVMEWYSKLSAEFSNNFVCDSVVAACNCKVIYLT